MMAAQRSASLSAYEMSAECSRSTVNIIKMPSKPSKFTSPSPSIPISKIKPVIQDTLAGPPEWHSHPTLTPPYSPTNSTTRKNNNLTNSNHHHHHHTTDSHITSVTANTTIIQSSRDSTPPISRNPSSDSHITSVTANTTIIQSSRGSTPPTSRNPSFHSNNGFDTSCAQTNSHHLPRTQSDNTQTQHNSNNATSTCPKNNRMKRRRSSQKMQIVHQSEPMQPTQEQLQSMVEQVMTRSFSQHSNDDELVRTALSDNLAQPETELFTFINSSRSCRRRSCE